MTFKERVMHHLTDNGMSDNQSAEVFKLVAADMDDMGGRWCDDIEGYPPMMQGIILLNTKRIAYKWITEHAPLAWFKPMFSPTT